ncbi:ciliogenesis and planar polarity effector 2-like isoform X1 [Pecten maximus]|uniref:ciliogenesis and planar polarity effector 2-like isoform X1 n=2 Tax=Pecten maximus TaxID=6579 RepID=UPI0014581E11|nr:ciliogenesis and planar polarity effector 2-like isoform X1 [Pecten maximus]
MPCASGCCPQGSLLNLDWHKTREGQEVLASVLQRNLTKLKRFGLLERPMVPLHISISEVRYKVFLLGKSGVGKTSTLAKLSGCLIPTVHSETQGIQTTTVFWPGKILQQNKAFMFQIQFWDTGENSTKKYDHIMPACLDKADAIIFLFSFIDKSSFEDIPHQLTRISTPKDNTTKLVMGTKFDQFAHSEITQRDIRDFEHNWKIPILKTRNIPDAENQNSFNDIAQNLNIICEHLWQRDLNIGGKGPPGDNKISYC